MNQTIKAVIAVAAISILGFLVWERIQRERDHYESYEKEAETPAQDESASQTAVPDREVIEQLLAVREEESYHFISGGDYARATNPRQGFACQLSQRDGSLHLAPLDSREAAWTLEMRSSSESPEVESDLGKVTLKRDEEEEWFINDARGLEHGFTLAEAPSSVGEDGKIRMDLQLKTDLRPELYSADRSVAFFDQEGTETLRYQGLLAYDAVGRDLPASFELSSASDSHWALAIHVDASSATYPVVIDPVFTSANGRLIGAAGNDRMGLAVSMSGNLLAVSSPFAEGHPGIAGGKVDIYRSNDHGSWALEKTLFPDNAGADDVFGLSIALNAETLVVGAPGDAELGVGAGAVYVYGRDAGGVDQWGLITKYVSEPGDLLGYSVAIEGNILAAGAFGRDAPGKSNVGAVLAAFQSSMGTWGPLETLPINNLNANDGCGSAVAVSGNRIACGVFRGETGATPADAGRVEVFHYTFDDLGDPMAFESKTITDLAPFADDQFGFQLAMTGDTLFVGAPRNDTMDGPDAGTVTRFDYEEPNWVGKQTLRASVGAEEDLFGRALSVSGDTLVVGAPGFDIGIVEDAGSVYTFECHGEGTDSWNLVEQTTRAANQTVSFGYSVTVSGDQFAVGGPLWENGIGGDDRGIVETYKRRSGTWQEVFASFGAASSGAIHGSSAAYGVPDSNAERGGVLVQRRTDHRWSSGAVITNPDDQEGSRFGHAVALLGEWLVVSSPHHDSGGMVNVGRVYLFRRSSPFIWNLFKTFDSPAPMAGGEFGLAVAMTSRWIFIGEPGANQGYIFDRYEGGANSWDISSIIDESAEGGRFGATIVVHGNFAAFGAPDRAGVEIVEGLPQPLLGAGQVKVYQTCKVGAEVQWSLTKTLPIPAGDGSFGVLNGSFGTGLSLHQSLLMVGEPGFDDDRGRAAVFAVNEGGPGNWGLVNHLVAPDAQSNDRIGEDVAVSTRWLFVDAPGKRVSGLEVGVVSIYDRLTLDGSPQAPISRIQSTGTSPEGSRSLSVNNGQLLVASNVAKLYREQRWSWIQQGQSLSSGADAFEESGFSVAVDGDYLVSGVPLDTVDGKVSAGSVQLYRRDATEDAGWIFVKDFFASNVTAGALFGLSVDIYQDTIVVGAPGWNGVGAVYVFERNVGGSDHWGQRRKIPIFLQVGDEFGAAVALHEDLLIAGSPKQDYLGNLDAGTAYVFERHLAGASAWGLKQTIPNPFPAADDFFANAVDVNRGRLLIGASNNGNMNQGAAYIFARPTGDADWELLDTLNAFDAEADDFFATSVALDGRHAIIGAPGDDEDGSGAGAAYVFEEADDHSSWNQLVKLTPGAVEDLPNPIDWAFGYSVGIHDDQAVVGAPGADVLLEANAGAVYVYEQHQTHGESWGFVEKLVGEGAGPTAAMGWSSALGYNVIVAGAPKADTAGSTNLGRVFIFGDVQSSHEVWLRRAFGDAVVDDPAQESAVWGQQADPDEDGLTNTMEAFMNTDPMTADSGDYVSGFYEGDELVLVCRVGKETHGASGVVKWSQNLAEWQTDGGSSPVAIEERVIADEVDHFMIEERASCPPGWERVFLRMEVTVP